jgi:hypothetical protein
MEELDKRLTRLEEKFIANCELQHQEWEAHNAQAKEFRGYVKEAIESVAINVKALKLDVIDYFKKIDERVKEQDDKITGLMIKTAVITLTAGGCWSLLFWLLDMHAKSGAIK